MKAARPTTHPLLALAAPLLVVLAAISFTVRHGSQRLQAVPALLIGCGLVVSGRLRRSRRRHSLAQALRSPPLSPPPG
ncbi:DUF3188 domain-containing protein [Synechococcus sp. CS-1325]|uniref:DUF3188 domain-containing protein n=1 Tax=unclassified Synechococcus TaxID=2626047 RepID=UPI000DB7A745|nr:MULTISPECIES: DUF3188 domain-containing protein [unclassified Synechococcus]PZV01756.1 MAG: DUF3188 domain-containing protein [Cyanobium sp.]MCT0198482.1 DUF3188 domain-containing protein [Synechococcus sp. CS-1325]MCT0213602.1 DUF3188 domain-containing protein [Synechococcus sp. CS-1326]MCT0230416.1 DUF3188 domain-containing protein [Synechococcus sp. CS-1324]MCT0232193.1 DUF3188 domain-containing protein [Synechococcus sp. CS-1327]